MRYHTGVPIGRGGMAEVFKAWDPVREEEVALKILRHDDPELRQRLRREARLQAGIDHPGICKIFDVGESDDGRPYVAMELVEGRPLDEVGRDLPVEQVVGLVARVAEAVQAAHAVGLIHRDLKPSNILVKTTTEGDQVPVVLDFGLAREVDTRELTQTGIAVGTPGYMSPEQAAGDRRIDRRTDIFSLGIILYELLADRLPFEGESSLEWVAAVMRDDPLPLRKIAPQVPRALGTIVMTCLERDPGRRYESAAALQEDLDRYLQGAPVAARAPSWQRRLRHFRRRHPVVATAMASSAVALLILGSYAGWARARERRQTVVAQQFGEKLQRIESLLRLAHLAPLHDVRSERDEVENLVADLEDELAGMRGDVRLPGLLALGRAHLILSDFSRAREVLDEAWQNGYRSPQVPLALGRALVGLYNQALRSADGIADAETRAAAVQDARRELAEPARGHLAALDLAALELEIYESVWIRGLLALAEDDWAAARLHGLEASRRRTWFHDGYLLAGRAALRQGSHLLEEGNIEASREMLALAEKAYEDSFRVAPSDPRTSLGRCRVERQRLQVAWDATEPLGDAFGLTAEFCSRALAVDPDSAEALTLRAEAAWTAGRLTARAGASPRSLLDQAVEDAGRAIELDPRFAPAWAARGNALWVRARWSGDHGEQVDDLYRRATDDLGRGLELVPGDTGLQLALAHILNDWGTRVSRRGEDPTSIWQRARGAYQQALASGGSKSSRVHNGLCALESELGYHQVQAGSDPSTALKNAVTACSRALEINPTYLAALNNLGLARWTQAGYQLAIGGDPGPALEDAVKQFEAVLNISPSRPTTSVNLANLLATLARWRFEHGEDLTAELERATTTIDSARERFPSDYHYVLSRVSLLRAERAARQDRSPQAYFAAALDHAHRALQLAPGPDRHMLLVYGYSSRAAWGLRQSSVDRSAAIRDVTAGLEAVDAVLAAQSDRAEALAEAARLYTLRAGLAGDGQDRDQWMARARANAEAAVALRPHLADDLEGILGRKIAA